MVVVVVAVVVVVVAVVVVVVVVVVVGVSATVCKVVVADALLNGFSGSGIFVAPVFPPVWGFATVFAPVVAPLLQ